MQSLQVTRIRAGTIRNGFDAEGFDFGQVTGKRIRSRSPPLMTWISQVDKKDERSQDEAGPDQPHLY